MQRSVKQTADLCRVWSVNLPQRASSGALLRNLGIGIVDGRVALREGLLDFKRKKITTRCFSLELTDNRYGCAIRQGDRDRYSKAIRDALPDLNDQRTSVSASISAATDKQ